MSDSPAGPGWWQASDDKWYPPEQHPGYRAPYQPTYEAPAPYQAPPSYQAPYQWQQPAQQSSSKAAAALITSILSFAACPVVLAIVGLVLASQAGREIRESGGRLTGQGMVTASRVIAIANLVISALAVLAFVVALAALPEAATSFRDGAEDAIAQTELDEAAGVQETMFHERGRYSADPYELEAEAPSVSWEPAPVPTLGRIAVSGGPGRVVLATLSGSGTCFYVQVQPGARSYASDEACRASESQTFGPSW